MTRRSLMVLAFVLISLFVVRPTGPVSAAVTTACPDESECATCVEHATYAICDLATADTRVLRARQEDGTWVTIGTVAVSTLRPYISANDDVAP